MPVEMLLREYAFRHDASIVDRRTHTESPSGTDGSYPRAGPNSQVGNLEIAVAKGIEKKLVEIETMAILGWYGPSTR
jgi:hypothetical protein